MKVVNLCFNLKDNSGHISTYIKALTVIFNSLNIHHEAFVPIDCDIKDEPLNWKFILPTRNSKKLIYFKDLLSSLCKYKLEDKTVIFIESFTITQFLIVTLFCLVQRKKIDNLWILFRNDNDFIGKSHFYKLLILINELFLRKVILLTDSSLLKIYFDSLLDRDLILLPIPHTQDILENLKLLKIRNINKTAWWPGSPRIEKGLNVINHLLVKSKVDNLNLIVSSKFSPAAKYKNISYVDDPLSDSQYFECLINSSFILLPYDPIIYGKATSGIFVEAVLANKIPIVSRGSWMHYELLRFNLDELAIDWRDYSFGDLSQFTSDDIFLKLDLMREIYSEFHSTKNYTKIISPLTI